MSHTPTVSSLAEAIGASAEPFSQLEEADLSPFLERVGDAKIVLLGEATHGTSEFYRMRARLTRALVEEKGYRLVCAEADWPDAEHVDDYVRHRDGKARRPREAFARFPTWMWRNTEVLHLIESLRGYNEHCEDPAAQVSFHGLDLYSLFASIHEVMEYLEHHDPALLEEARSRYGALLAYEPEAADYGREVYYGTERDHSEEAIAMLSDLFRERLQSSSGERERAFDAEQNARVVKGAEAYYRIMFYGGRESWNLRDSHMFATLEQLREVRGPDAKAVVWAHNSHLGDASHTSMSRRGEFNLGQLCRDAYGDDAYLVGFGTDHGTVAAADDWGRPVRIKEVQPSLRGSVERLCHEHGPKRFFLPLRRLRDRLHESLLERAIGVVYRPQTERQSHYFQTDVVRQFDEYIWFDETSAVHPLERERAPDLPARHPFLLGD